MTKGVGGLFIPMAGLQLVWPEDNYCQKGPIQQKWFINLFSTFMWCVQRLYGSLNNFTLTTPILWIIKSKVGYQTSWVWQKHSLHTEYSWAHPHFLAPPPLWLGQAMWLVLANGPWVKVITSLLDWNFEEPVHDPLTLSSTSKSITRMSSSLHLWVKASK